MSHSLPYSIPYITAPAPQYMLAPHHHQHAHMPGSVHLVSSTQMRVEHPQRKRPKYTRSKTGCLTCRSKKIKCDESKPKCQRCATGQRECNWPEPAPAKKKTPARKNSAAQDSASTTESLSRSSDSSTSRDVTPNTPNTRDFSGNIPDPTRRHSDSHGYPYAEHTTQLNRPQTMSNNGVHNQLLHTASSAALLGSGIPSYSASITNSYDFASNSGGSISSRGNSRPSTANSISPAHFTPPPVLSNMEARDYPRWETLSTSRSEASYAYYT